MKLFGCSVKKKMRIFGKKNGPKTCPRASRAKSQRHSYANLECSTTTVHRRRRGLQKIPIHGIFKILLNKKCGYSCCVGVTKTNVSSYMLRS